MFGNKKIWCHHASSGVYYDVKPIRFVKMCPCGANYQCPICGYGEGTLPHKCKSVATIPLIEE